MRIFYLMVDYAHFFLSLFLNNTTFAEVKNYFYVFRKLFFFL